MKSHSLIRSRIILAALCGSAIVGSALAPVARADEWDKKTVLTVDQPIQVTKTVLQPGKYVFKLLNSQSDRHIVQIFNERQDHIYATVLAIPNYRLEPTGHSRFAFWETPPGHVKALRAWFYPGDNFGQEFTYPKQLAMAETTTTTAMTNSMTTSTTQTDTNTADRSAEEVTPTPQPMVEQQQQQVEQTEQQPVHMAENTPPPAPVEQPEPAPAPAPALPKTASLYPLIGLAGLFLLGVRGFLRRKQVV